MTEFQLTAVDAYSVCSTEHGVLVSELIAWADLIGIWDVERLVRVVKAAETESNQIRTQEMKTKAQNNKVSRPPRPARRRR